VEQENIAGAPGRELEARQQRAWQTICQSRMTEIAWRYESLSSFEVM